MPSSNLNIATKKFLLDGTHVREQPHRRRDPAARRHTAQTAGAVTTRPSLCVRGCGGAGVGWVGYVWVWAYSHRDVLRLWLSLQMEMHRQLSQRSEQGAVAKKEMFDTETSLLSKWRMIQSTPQRNALENKCQIPYREIWIFIEDAELQDTNGKFDSV